MAGFPGDLWPFRCSDERVYFIFVLQRDLQIQFDYFVVAIELHKKWSDVIVWGEEKKLTWLSRKNNPCHISHRLVTLFLPLCFFCIVTPVSLCISRRKFPDTPQYSGLFLTTSEYKISYYCCLKFPLLYTYIHIYIYIYIYIYSFSILSDDRSKASSKTIPPHNAI